AKTGKIVWEFFLVPKTEGDAVRGPLGATPLNMSTWQNAPGIPISGGGTWTSYTLDTKTGRLYVPGGNPAPDFAIAAREGENFYTDSVIVLDAKTGDYKYHFKLVPNDWHDWDVSNPPVLIQTMGGKQIMVVAPKDGYLYGFDLADNILLYRVPVTQIENVVETFAPGEAVHFCPGAVGGHEWNSPAYDPRTNLVFTGEVDWCDTATPKDVNELRSVPLGQPWAGMATWNPFSMFGRFSRADGHWAGWLYATDADTGVWKWRLKSNYPIVSGMTPTAGGRRVLRRRWRQLLCARRRQRRKALGPGARRRDRRRRDHLYGERCAKSCCGGRLYAPGLANEDRDRKDRGAGLGQRLREPVRAPPGASPAIPSHGRSSTLLRCALGTRWSWLPGLPMFSPSSKTENPGPDGFTAYARWFGPAISPMGSEPPGRFG